MGFKRITTEIYQEVLWRDNIQLKSFFCGRLAEKAKM